MKANDFKGDMAVVMMGMVAEDRAHVMGMINLANTVVVKTKATVAEGMTGMAAAVRAAATEAEEMMGIAAAVKMAVMETTTYLDNTAVTSMKAMAAKKDMVAALEVEAKAAMAGNLVEAMVDLPTMIRMKSCNTLNVTAIQMTPACLVKHFPPSATTNTALALRM